MADEAARRRELRRKRILDNAEERKKKIFGANSTTNSECDNEHPLTTPDVSGNDSNNVSTEEQVSSETEQSRLGQQVEQPEQSHRTSEEIASRNHGPSLEQQDFLTNVLRQTSGTSENGVLPQLEPLMRLLNSQASDDLSTSSYDQGTQEASETTAVSGGAGPLKSHPLVPVMLGIAVCGLLSANFGYVVQHSIGVPFLLWEAQYLWCSRATIQHSARNTPGLLPMALMLSGLKQQTITAYFQVYIIIKTLFGDFCLYILTVVIWYHCLGLPGAVLVPSSSTPMLSPQEQMTNVPPQDTEAFDIMEDF